MNLHNDLETKLRGLLDQRMAKLLYLNVFTIVLAILIAAFMFYFITGFYRSNRLMFNQLLVDISGRKLAEVELRKSKMRNRSVIKAALDGIITIDEEDRVIEFNPSAEKLFGYRSEAIRGRFLADLIIPPEQRDRHRQALKRYCMTGRNSSLVGKYVELKALRADRSEICVELTILPIQQKGRPLITAFVRDITERKHLQEQLQLAKKMEAVGQLTGGIAHDFNNILVSILGYTELAQGVLEEADNQKVKGYLSEVLTSGKRARDLVTKMQAFSHGYKREVSPTRLPALIRGFLINLGSVLPSSIEIDLQFDGDDLTVMTNPVQMHQLLMSLCINAGDAMDGKGYLVIGLKPVNAVVAECSSCHGSIRGDYIQLTVRDTGRGITPQQQNRIFDPFFTTKLVGEGSGMGLSLVHGIMHDHGGHIVIDTEVGKGSSFGLLFPVIEARVNTASSPA